MELYKKSPEAQEERFDKWFKSLPLDYQQRLIVTWIYIIIYDFLLCPCWVIKHKPKDTLIHERQSYEIVGSSPFLVDCRYINWPIENL